MSNLFNQAKSFTKAMVTQIAAGCPMASKEQQKERHDICGECEFLKPKEYRCGICSCKLFIKIPLATSECPKGYWGKVKGENNE